MSHRWAMPSWSSIRTFLFPPLPADGRGGHSILYDRLSILVLSLEYVVAGTAHYASLDNTIREVPGWVPFDPASIAVISGIIEVTTGILILLPTTRRLAAIVSLCMLIAYIPSMYEILRTGNALPIIASSREVTTVLDTIFRIIILPNNIYLAILSVYLIQNPGATLSASRFYSKTWQSDETVLREDLSKDSESTVVAEAALVRVARERALLLTAAIFLVANCAGFLTLEFAMIQRHQEAYLWAMMCIALGALVGFLFGVPKINNRVRHNEALLPNDNHEAISDWITKIIVGVGLINFGQIGAFLSTTSQNLAGSLGSSPTFALGLILYFFAAGVMEGYILTRTFLSRQFVDTV